MKERWKIVSCMLAVLVAISLLAAAAAFARAYEDPRLVEARTLIYDGKYTEGLAILDKVLEEQPGHRDALFLKALAYEWQGRLEEALTVYRTIVSVHDEDIDAWLAVAKLEAWRENYDEAISLYGTLISKFGQEPPILIGLARTLSWADRFDEALQYYERVLLQEPDNVEALAGKAQVLRWMGETHEARKVIRQAQHLDPEFPDVQKEGREIDLALSPRVLTSYSQSLEKDYLRSGDTYNYNLGNRTWRSTVTFSPDLIEDLGFSLWTSRDWELDKTLDKHNFEITSIGFAANVGVRPWEPVKVGGNLRIAQYGNHDANVLFALLPEEEREENFDVWASAQLGTWGANVGVGTYPFFEKTSTPLLDKLEIGRQTVTRIGVTKSFSRITEAQLGYEAGSYSDGNDRNRVHGSVRVSPSSAPWFSLLYNIHYQDYKTISRNYFTPLDELNQGLEAGVRKTSPKAFFGAGLRFGFSSSENFGNIFSVGASGSLSRTVTDRLRFEGNGSVSYDDNKYLMHAFYVGLELRL
ncbi:MAG: tetratricopeptide repeat protein [Candidatus Eisenbacteria bacterium]|nr:tetratricopeptide repeat protein [Candidatus Eisenbacteria bacterium]